MTTGEETGPKRDKVRMFLFSVTAEIPEVTSTSGRQEVNF